MNITEVMSFYNVRYMKELAKKLGLTPQAVYEWRREKIIPYKWQVKFSEESKGSLVIDGDIEIPNHGCRKPMKEYVRKSNPKHGFLDEMDLYAVYRTKIEDYRSIVISSTYYKDKKFSIVKNENEVVITRIR